jgi:hypothetical protein
LSVLRTTREMYASSDLMSSFRIPIIPLMLQKSGRDDSTVSKLGIRLYPCKYVHHFSQQIRVLGRSPNRSIPSHLQKHVYRFIAPKSNLNMYLGTHEDKMKPKKQRSLQGVASITLQILIQNIYSLSYSRHDLRFRHRPWESACIIILTRV